MSFREAIVSEIPRLRRYARALVGNTAAADDLVQDTLERALQKFSLFKPGNLRTWLFSIMHNLFVSEVRSARAIEGEAVLAEIPARGAADDNLKLLDLARSLRQLPDEQREVLLLVGLEELSYQEAAQVLGVPIGTVMSRLSRGRGRLRQLLAESGDAHPPHLQVIK